MIEAAAHKQRGKRIDAHGAGIQQRDRGIGQHPRVLEVIGDQRKVGIAGSQVYLYSRAQSVMGGTSQIQRNLVATRILGLPTA
jgi:alkylation response protein AidB-like acyl-CoA dehydrogenase